MTHADPGEAADFAAAFRRFLEWVHSEDSQSSRNEVVALISDFLGAGASEHSVVAREWSSFEHVNLQTALDAWSERDGRTVTVRGITTPPHFGDVELQQL